MMSSTWKQMFTIHILPNISRGKSNQTMEIGQLIDCDMKNTFLQKLCKKMRQGD